MFQERKLGLWRRAERRKQVSGLFEGGTHASGASEEEAQLANGSIVVLGREAVRDRDVVGDRPGQEWGDGVGYLLNFTADAANKMEAVGKSLETGTLTKGQETLLNRVDEFPGRGAGYGEARLVEKEALETGRSTSSFLDWGAVHNTAEGATTKRLVLQMLREILHCLARLKVPNAVGLYLAQGKDGMLRYRRSTGAQVCLKVVGGGLGERG